MTKSGALLSLVAALCLGAANPSLAQLTQDAYLTNFNYATVAVLDTATQKIVNTIPVGIYPNAAVVTPDGRFAYVANELSLTVSVIDTATQTVVNTIAAGNDPFGVVVTPDNRFVYVTNFNADTVSVIRTATQTLADTISLASLSSTEYLLSMGVAVTPDGLYVYVTNFNTHTVSVINTGTQTVVNTIRVGRFPFGVVVIPSSPCACVTSLGSVSVIDTATQTVIHTIPQPGGPIGVAATPDGEYVYVTNESSNNSVSVINTATQSVARTIHVGFPSIDFGNFVGPNLITGSLGVENEAALASLGFGQFMDFRGGTLELKARMNDTHTLSLIAPGGTINVNNGFDSTFSGSIIGSGSFTKTGAGALILTGTNTYSGGSYINGGTFAVNHGGSLGTGPLSFHGATLESLAACGGITSSNAIILEGGGATFLADTGTSSTLSGAISGGGALTKIGPGTLLLTGANTYSGGTNIDGGTLVINNYGNLGTGPIRFHGGVLRFNSPAVP